MKYTHYIVSFLGQICCDLAREISDCGIVKKLYILYLLYLIIYLPNILKFAMRLVEISSKTNSYENPL